MDRWNGRIVMVTGACSSLGETLCKELALSGLTVVGLARRRHRVRVSLDHSKFYIDQHYAKIWDRMQ